MTAPEVFSRHPVPDSSSSVDPDYPPEPSDSPLTTILPEADPPDLPSCDSWSLGMMLSSLVLGIPLLWPGAKIGQIGRYMYSRHKCFGCVFYIYLVTCYSSVDTA